MPKIFVSTAYMYIFIITYVLAQLGTKTKESEDNYWSLKALAIRR